MAQEAQWEDGYLQSAKQQEQEQLFKVRDEIHQHLLDNTDPKVLQHLAEDALMDKIQGITAQVAQKYRLALTANTRERLYAAVHAELRGFGPLQELLDDSSVSEIMVNGSQQVYVERYGKLELTDVAFSSDSHVRRIIEKIIAPLGRWIDETSPMVDARLPDGSRVNAIIPPVLRNGPTITIRKFAEDPLTPEALVNLGTTTAEMMEFMRACVVARLNIIVSGGTGGGKTTTLNVLSSFIPPGQRIITIEDAAELQLRQEHILSMESRPPNLEGSGEVTIRQLLRNALRMRPDRIVIGEVRGGEALDMLQAMNTGHDGSLSTVHSNGPRDTLSRLETMVLMAGTELPSRAIREQVASALDLIIHQARFADGHRRITHITEVQGIESGTITLQDIYRYEQRGVDEDGTIIGTPSYTGLRPKFAEKLLTQGIELPAGLADAWARRQ